MSIPQPQTIHARAMWRRCLASAFRTALACSIVGGATLFGPKFLTKQVAFPAFSYVTVILIVTDATFGDTLRGCWMAVYATMQGVCPAILSLWLIGPARLTASTTATLVAVSAFVVALPENTHLILKRIALGQIVIVYVIGFINGGRTEAVMHPVHVAASTAVGLVACVLALLFPYPRLACCEVKQNCKLYIENASQRLKLFVEACSAEDNTLPKKLILQSKSLNNKATKLLLSIKSKQESMQWERLPLMFLRPSHNKNPGEILQGLETILRGMENALSNCSEFPIRLMKPELKHDLIKKMEQILDQVKSMALGKSVLPQPDQVANIKAQGTVLGTVYGVIGCFVFEKYVKIRFISLFPWFVFCSFLRKSKMYGQAGGISAVIGAVLILGRKNFGTASEFAIARIVETFIGLSCSIMIDMILQPTRAAVLAKDKLSVCLEALRESVGSMSLGSNSEKLRLEESLKKVKVHVNELGRYIEEAEVEPNFWFLPFHSACYGKMKGSLSRMVDLLVFGSHALRFIEQESGKIEGWKEAVVKLENDIKISREKVCFGIKCFERVSLVKSLVVLEREFEKRIGSLDLELGKWSSGLVEDDEMEKNINSFIGHLEEVFVNHIVCEEKDEEHMKNGVMLSLSALVFCMNGLIKENKEIEKGIKELVQWENPSSQVDLNDILCKVHALEKNVTI